MKCHVFQSPRSLHYRLLVLLLVAVATNFAMTSYIINSNSNVGTNVRTCRHLMIKFAHPRIINYNNSDPDTITLKHKRHVEPLSSTKKGKLNLDRPFQTIEEHNNSCHPTDPWQITPRPSCNNIHEIGFMRNEQNPRALKYVASGGWRIAWRLMDNDDTKYCLKTIK